MNKGYEYFEDLFQNIEKKGDVTVFTISEHKYLYLGKNNLIFSYVRGDQSNSKSYNLKYISNCSFTISFFRINFETVGDRGNREHLFEIDIKDDTEYDVVDGDFERIKELTEKANALLFFMLENMKDNEVNY